MTRKRYARWAWAGGLGLGLGLGCGGGAGPELLAATPTTGAAGAQIAVSGLRLCGAAADCASAGGQLQVGLGQPVRAQLVAYADTALTFVVPALAPSGPTSLVLTVDDTASNALPFEVSP